MPNPPDRLHCNECGEVIPNRHRPGVGEVVQGLRVNRAAGGPNQIKNWVGMGTWLCHLCVPLHDPKKIVTDQLF